jgi:acetyl esterase
MQRLARKHLSPLTLAPLKLQRSMAQIGPIWAQDIERHSRVVFDGYAPLLRDAPRDGVIVTRDVAYGSHPRQLLDVYHTRRGVGQTALPVVLFVHGGAYVGGDRNVTPEIYGNVSTWFARHDCIGVNIGYRLAPDAAYPEGARDIGRAVAWVHDNIQAFGGDTSRILLVGHSSGGTHVASYVFDTAARGEPEPRILGQVLISARLRADIQPENPNAAGVRAYFGDDPAVYHARSPITHAAGSRVPTMIVAAEFESPLLDVYALDLFHALSQTAPPELRFVRMERHNHTSIVAHFNTAEEILGNQILDFIASIPIATGTGR